MPLPTGTILAFGGTVAPAGFLLCGQAVSRATFAALFAVIGTTYGPGNGTTTFDLPATNGRTLVGVGISTGPINWARGTQSGQEFITLAATDLPQLAGGVSFLTSNGEDSVMDGSGPDAVLKGPASTNVDSVNAGSPNSPIKIVQPSLGVNWIIAT